MDRWDHSSLYKGGEYNLKDLEYLFERIDELKKTNRSLLTILFIFFVSNAFAWTAYVIK